MKILNYALILLFTLGMLSCGSSGSDSDSTPPVIKFTNLSVVEGVYTPITVDRFEINIELSDDEDLKSISFKDPTGLKYVSDFLLILKEALDAQESDQLTGETKVVKIPLVDLLLVEASKYTITCNVTDASGNPTTNTAYFEIKK